MRRNTIEPLYGSGHKSKSKKEPTRIIKTQTLSNCTCKLVCYDSQFLLCSNAMDWLSIIEARTDSEVRFDESLRKYERV